MIIGAIICILAGFATIYLGYCIGVKHKINFIHEYQYTNVKEEDKKAFTSSAGKYTRTIGYSIIIMGISFIFNNEIAIYVGIGISVLIFIYAIVKIILNQQKFNGGMF